jgi:putative Mn2+ efflux pump MntP
MLGNGIWFASVVIGLVTGALSLVAIRLGSRIGRTFGRQMEVAGGLMLIAIGLRLLVEHISAAAPR